MSRIDELMPSAKKLRDSVERCYKALNKRDAKFEGRNKGLKELASELFAITRSAIDWKEIGYAGEPSVIGAEYVKTREFRKLFPATIGTWFNFQNDSRTLGRRDIVFLPYIDATNRTNIMQFVGGFSKLIAIADEYDFSNVTNAQNAFGGCSSLAVFLQVFKKVTNLSGAFKSCNNLKGIKNASEWDVSNVTTMEGIFFPCAALHDIDVSGWNLHKCATMKDMFYQCTSLERIDTSMWFDQGCACANYTNMFNTCGKLISTVQNPLSLKNFFVNKPTSGYISVTNMFAGCSRMECIDFSDSGSEQGNIGGSVQGMFSGCTNLTEIRGVLNFEHVTNTGGSGLFGQQGSKIRRIFISNLKVDITLPYINGGTIDYDCLEYMIENAASTASSPIKIHIYQWTSSNKAKFEASENWTRVSKYCDPSNAAYKGITLAD